MCEEHLCLTVKKRKNFHISHIPQLTWSANFWICYTTLNFSSIGFEKRHFFRLRPPQHPTSKFGHGCIFTCSYPHSYTFNLQSNCAFWPNLSDFDWYQVEYKILVFKIVVFISSASPIWCWIQKMGTNRLCFIYTCSHFVCTQSIYLHF